MSEISNESVAFVEVRRFVSDIQEAIKIAFRDRKDELGNFNVAKVELKLHTIAEQTAGGKITFKIPFIGDVEIGPEGTNSVTNELHLVFPHEEFKEGATLFGDSVRESITEAVEAIREAIDELNDDPNTPYALSEATINLKFATDRSGNIKVPFFEHKTKVAATQEVILLVKKL